jgi:uncharacterized FlaG/YvyC family protein
MEITSNQVKPIISESTLLVKTPTVEVKKTSTDGVTINSGEALKNTEDNSVSQKQAGNLQVAVSQINDYVQNLQRDLQFTVDEATGKDVVTVIDSESKEVIRQLPSEEALVLARRLAENRDAGIQLISTQV